MLKITGQTQPSTVLQHQKQEGSVPATSCHLVTYVKYYMGIGRERALLSEAGHFAEL